MGESSKDLIRPKFEILYAAAALRPSNSTNILKTTFSLACERRANLRLLPILQKLREKDHNWPWNLYPRVLHANILLPLSAGTRRGNVRQSKAHHTTALFARKDKTTHQTTLDNREIDCFFSFFTHFRPHFFFVFRTHLTSTDLYAF